MPKITEEETESFTNKLKKIGLDLENIPDFLKDFKALEFRPVKRFDNKEYMVYRYIPVQKIQVLITPTNRLTDVKEKYALAKPLSEYLDSKSEEGIENFATFLNMLKNTRIEEIQEVEEKQKQLNKAIPFRVKYEKNYLWQIYYSEYSNQYFMLVPSEEEECGCLFYLLKEQIKQAKEGKENAYIYVPIANFEPSNTILKKSERNDLENYLWLFTKNWPNVYEVMQKDESTKIIIVGEVEVYPSVCATYRIELNNREEANHFYKELKALFILQTELSEYYSFRAQIGEKGELQFYYGNTQMDYQELSQFIKIEYLKMEKNIQEGKKQNRILEIKLESLKQEASKKEKEFLEKQKEISTYLQYKKTFLGRVKYFFTKKKAKKKIEELVEETSNIEENNIEERTEPKIFYTIEDLITICHLYTNIMGQMKNRKLDVEALELKIKNLSKKIENATLYINEIDSHKKSIFEFWKFSSKDDMQALNAGEEQEIQREEKTLRKVFEYENDREDIVKQLDKKQRERLSKEEQDSIFVSKTQILPILNKIKTLVKVSDGKIAELLEELKQEAKREEKLYSNEEYDIFGGMSEEKTKIRVLGKNKHREIEKDKFQILGINKDTTLMEFKETLKKIEATLAKSFDKVQNNIDMPIYRVIPKEEKLEMYGYTIYSLNAAQSIAEANTKEKEYNLIKVNLQENMPAIFYTNIIFFDNNNQTLPLGMEKANEVLLNAAEYSFTLKDQKTIYTNQYFSKDIDSAMWETKKIQVYEYDIALKEGRKERK